jgi:hypothetical protein
MLGMLNKETCITVPYFYPYLGSWDRSDLAARMPVHLPSVWLVEGRERTYKIVPG